MKEQLIILIKKLKDNPVHKINKPQQLRGLFILYR